MTKQNILSFPPSLADALVRAQRLANEKQTAYGVWEHVGCYGLPTGDIPGRHTFKVEALNKMDPDTTQYALVGCVDPEGV